MVLEYQEQNFAVGDVCKRPQLTVISVNGCAIFRLTVILTSTRNLTRNLIRNLIRNLTPHRRRAGCPEQGGPDRGVRCLKGAPNLGGGPLLEADRPAVGSAGVRRPVAEPVQYAHDRQEPTRSAAGD